MSSEPRRLLLACRSCDNANSGASADESRAQTAGSTKGRTKPWQSGLRKAPPLTKAELVERISSCVQCSDYAELCPTCERLLGKNIHEAPPRAFEVRPDVRDARRAERCDGCFNRHVSCSII